jgi:hypothetical protein
MLKFLSQPLKSRKDAKEAVFFGVFSRLKSIFRSFLYPKKLSWNYRKKAQNAQKQKDI